MSETGQNTPEFTVSEIASAVKRTLEGSFSRVRVRGEITELRAYASGHQYFALKDENAKIRAIIWKGAASRIGLKAENGVEVIATGKLTSYPERSEYQLIVERLEYAGVGALLARIEALKTKLHAEGLFQRKRALPLLPRVIGVITSAQGAVLQDIKTTIARRFPRPILLWPVPVQGDGAADKIATAITGFNNLPADFPQPDVLIVARGGGSLEDLMAFNEESVVRAAAASRIPLISAVGHETDTTLIDFASSRRAPTPTAAAEMAVPARLELLADLGQQTARLDGALARRTTQASASLERAASKLPDLPAMLGTIRQRLDDRAERLTLALPNYISARRARLERLVPRHPREILTGLNGRVEFLGHRLTKSLPDLMRMAQKRFEATSYRLIQPSGEIAKRQAALALLIQRLSPQIHNRRKEASIRLETLASRLESVSYQRVLARGFALVTTTRGTPITAAADISPGTTLRLRFADGQATVKASGMPKPAQLDLDL
ncbi:exodeoxyribonuclease VII large subunit [Acidocella sp.]|uniref:exodeoxyribonuclease VII large subunit n=1 Tax=Acidocella sp. TaxID=50710 RepID=UPI003D025B0B